MIPFIYLSCEKDLSISDFQGEFENYRSELKIEGLLQLDKPEDSIIRIIKSSLITEKDLFNGIDDDGDGIVDEYDEILPLVQDTSAIVTVTNLSSGLETDFQFAAIADSFIHYEDEEHGNEEKSYISYGGYKPTSNNFEIESDASYQIEIYSQAFEKTISGLTTVYPAVEFIDTLFNFQDSTVTMKVGDIKQIFWKSDLMVTAYYITYELGTHNGNEWQFEFIQSYTMSRDNDLSQDYAGFSIGRGFIPNYTTATVLKLTVESLSPEYGRYIFSSLPLNDAQRSNLRDENGIPVMGCFGSISAKSIYIIIEE